MFFDTASADVEELHDGLFLQKEVRVYVLRLDKIHGLVSGNKIFKLQYFLEEALQTNSKTVLSFGGAFSNHLAATAYACKTLHLKSIGIVRGERPAQLSTTLQQCMADGMQLKFISRNDYDKKEDEAFISALRNEFGACTIIPEGGYHPLGAKGAALIMDLLNKRHFTHICTASGTATTLAGILMAAGPERTVINIPVLKGITDIEERIQFLTGKTKLPVNLMTLPDYHFGGYAKKTDELISFMNHCWLHNQLPLDFVYTGKMLFAVYDSIKNNLFEKGSEIICLHTGGLQGNKSLPLNSLLF